MCASFWPPARRRSRSRPARPTAKRIFLRRGRRRVPAARPPRHSAHEIRRATAGEAAGNGAPLRLRAAQQVAAAHGGARASRRHRHLRKDSRPACRTSCSRCRTTSSTIRGDWCGWVWQRKSPCGDSAARQLRQRSHAARFTNCRSEVPRAGSALRWPGRAGRRMRRVGIAGKFKRGNKGG